MFSGKIISFLIIQESSYSRATFLDKGYFQNIWKKNMVFRAVFVGGLSIQILIFRMGTHQRFSSYG